MGPHAHPVPTFGGENLLQSACGELPSCPEDSRRPAGRPRLRLPLLLHVNPQDVLPVGPCVSATGPSSLVPADSYAHGLLLRSRLA
jgi:hypothetical protein